jgi:hypothetical protein
MGIYISPPWRRQDSPPVRYTAQDISTYDDDTCSGGDTNDVRSELKKTVLSKEILHARAYIRQGAKGPDVEQEATLVALVRRNRASEGGAERGREAET